MARKEEFETKFIKRMTEKSLDITTTEGKKDFIRNLIAYNIILEGIWFYSGFMVALSFRQRNLLRNFGSLIDWIVRDESLHLKFGINLILTTIEENEDLQDPEFADEIRQMILDGVAMEEEYNKALLPNGILGKITAVQTFYKFINRQRAPPGKNLAGAANLKPAPAAQRAAAKEYLRIVEWAAADVDPDPAQLGLQGSPTKVKRIENVVFAAKEAKKLTAADNDINELMVELIASHTLG
jgi:ribonucleoside-diphosphate reductase beta chain